MQLFLVELDTIIMPGHLQLQHGYASNAALSCGAGYYYNAGTPATPAWLCFKKQTEVYHAQSTAGRLAVASNVATLQPGLSITFTIPAGQTADVQIMAYIGFRNTATTSSAYSICDVTVYRNGAFIPVGGWNRIETLNGNNQNAFNGTSINTKETLTAGTYTYEVWDRRFGGNVSVDIGGNCTTDVNCGEMTVIVNYK